VRTASVAARVSSWAPQKESLFAFVVPAEWLIARLVSGFAGIRVSKSCFTTVVTGTS
jgi:hypothetical protein